MNKRYFSMTNPSEMGTFLKGYLLDEDRFANKSIFDSRETSATFASTYTKQVIQKISKKYMNRRQLNRSLQTEIGNFYNMFQIWPPEIDFNKSPRVEFLNESDESASLSDAKLSNGRSLDRLNRLIISTVTKTSGEELELSLSQFKLSQEAIDDFRKIDSFHKAFEFVSDYGTDFPLCTYIKETLRVDVIEISSYELDEASLLNMGLTEIYSFANLSSKQTDEIDEQQSKYRDKQPDGTFRYKFQIHSSTFSPIYKPIQSSIRHAQATNPKIQWIPMWKIVHGNLDRNEQRSFAIKLLKHASMLKVLNYHFKFMFYVNLCEKYGERKIANKLNSIEQCWNDFLFKMIKIKSTDYFMKHHNHKEGLEDEEDNDFIENNYLLIYNELIEQNKFFFRHLIESNVILLDRDVNFNRILLENLRYYKIGLLYVSKSLALDDPEKWQQIGQNFFDNINHLNARKDSDKPYMGIVIDCELNECISVEYLFKKNEQTSTTNKNTSHANYKYNDHVKYTEMSSHS